MRVVHVINGLGAGGAERSFAELAPHYADLGVDVRVACLFRRDEGVQSLVERAGVPVTVLRSNSVLGRARELTGLLRSAPADLVHTTIFEADTVGRLAARRSRIPVLTSVVNTSYDDSRLGDPRVRKWKLEAARAFDGLLARHLTDHFHALTEAVKRATVADLGVDADRITVVPRGRDPSRLGRRTTDRRARIRAELGVGPATSVVLAVGRQEYQKGHAHLLEALPRVRADVSDLVVWVAGRRGNQSAALRSLVSDLGLGDFVRFLGHREDVPELMVGADVLAFPSLYEGFGGTLIEAMALELPIVATDIPAIREVTADGTCATLVSAADPDSLAAAITAAIGSPNASAETTASARRRFEDRYTIRSVAADMVDLFRRVAGSP